MIADYYVEIDLRTYLKIDRMLRAASDNEIDYAYTYF